MQQTRFLYKNLWVFIANLRDDGNDVQYNNNIYNNISFYRWHTTVNERLMAPGNTLPL